MRTKNFQKELGFITEDVYSGIPEVRKANRMVEYIFKR